MSIEHAVIVMEQLSDKLGALENFLLMNEPTLWLRWQRNKEQITTQWLYKLMEESQ